MDRRNKSRAKNLMKSYKFPINKTTSLKHPPPNAFWSAARREAGENNPSKRTANTTNSSLTADRSTISRQNTHTLREALLHITTANRLLKHQVSNRSGNQCLNAFHMQFYCWIYSPCDRSSFADLIKSRHQVLTSGTNVWGATEFLREHRLCVGLRYFIEFIFILLFVSSLFHCTLVLIMSFKDCRLKFWEHKAKYNTRKYFFHEG